MVTRSPTRTGGTSGGKPTSTAQRRERLQRIIAKARAASPSGTLGGAVGRAGVKGTPQARGVPTTTIIRDPTTGRKKQVDIASLPKAQQEAIKAGDRAIRRSTRIEMIRLRQGRKTPEPIRQEIKKVALRKQGFTLKKGLAGAVVAVKGDQELLLTKEGKITLPSKEVSEARIKRARQLAMLKRATGEIQPVPKLKGLPGIRQRLRRAARLEETKIIRDKGVGEKVFRGVAVLGLIGAARGGLGVLETIRHPIKTAKDIARALAPRQLPLTARALGQQFTVDPVGTVAEFAVYRKSLGLAGRGIKNSPVGRFVSEEVFIRAQPKEIRVPVRAIIKSSKAQERFNPAKVKTINRVDFGEVKALTKTEARVIAKTVRDTDSVIFGSLAQRTLGRGRTPLPKDVDLATRSISTFNKKFMDSLPKATRKNYKIKGQKIIRVSNSEALMDVKPLSRLVPDRNLITRRGQLPVTGLVKRIGIRKGSILPTIKRRVGVTQFTVPTQPFKRVKGIKLVGFGEQTTRKGLGTLQVLIEKNARRAKDPQSFIVDLEVQLSALKRSKPLTPVGRIQKIGRIRTIGQSLKILKSKQFSNLLEKKVPGLTKEYPILKKINIKRLKTIKPQKAKATARRIIAKRRIPKKRPPTFKKPEVTRPSISRSELQRNIRRLPKKQQRAVKSRLPSRLPSRVPSSLLRSRLPSGLLKSVLPARPSKLPSKIPRRVSRLPSKLPRKPSKLPSKLPRKPSKLPKKPSRLPSRLPRKPSKLPSRIPSRIPSRLPSKLPAKKPVKFPAKKPRKLKLKEKRKLIKKIKMTLRRRKKFIFNPDLFSLIFGKVATKAERVRLLRKGRIFTGIELRKIIVR